MLARWRRAVVLRLTILRANDASDQPGQLPPNSARLHLRLCDAQSLPATAHFRARSVPAAKNNPETQSPFFRSADAPPRTTSRYKARVLQISQFLIPDVPAPPACTVTSSFPRPMHQKEKLFRCGRFPLRSRARLQFAGPPFETICKYREQSVGTH